MPSLPRRRHLTCCPSAASRRSVAKLPAAAVQLVAAAPLQGSPPRRWPRSSRQQLRRLSPGCQSWRPGHRCQQASTTSPSLSQRARRLTRRLMHGGSASLASAACWTVPSAGVRTAQVSRGLVCQTQSSTAVSLGSSTGSCCCMEAFLGDASACSHFVFAARLVSGDRRLQVPRGGIALWLTADVDACCREPSAGLDDLVARRPPFMSPRDEPVAS